MSASSIDIVLSTGLQYISCFKQLRCVPLSITYYDSSYTVVSSAGMQRGKNEIAGTVAQQAMYKQ